jgi:peptidoglycan/LPS O-acetylase OafA/YrhL
VTLCLAVALSLAQGQIVFGGQFLLTFGFFATLLQAWFPGIASLSYYNGVSWYLSAILFCYALTPVVAYVTRHAKERFNASGHQFIGEALLFSGLFVLRVLLEVAPALYPKAFYGYSLHTSPLIRLLEYAMAFIAGCVFVERADKRAMAKPRFVCSSFVEVSLCVGLIVLVIWSGGGPGLQSILPRWVFVALFLGLVYVLACGKGIISRMLGTRPFLLFSYIELEFYMFHQLIIRFVGSGYVRTLLPVINSGVVRAAVALTLSIVISVLWHILATRVKKDAAITIKGY